MLPISPICSSSSTQNKIIEEIEKLNGDTSVHGIVVELPLVTDDGIGVDFDVVINMVDPRKDVDGLTTINQGKLATGVLDSFIPCTPAGCLDLIKMSGVTMEGAHAVVVGRSRLVGTPMAELLKWSNATVTICHFKTQNLESIVNQADILVVAIGQPQFIPGSWIKPGSVVIDTGINSIPDNSKKSGQYLFDLICFCTNDVHVL